MGADLLSHIAEGLRLLAVPIDELHQDPSNARTGHDIDKIAGSLAQYGQRKPLVANRLQGNKIETGNGTWQAARKLGWSHIAVVFVDDDPATAAGYGIADNRTGDMSRWDPDALEDAIDLAGDLFTGFSIGDLADVIKPTPIQNDMIVPEPEIERADQLREIWRTERGQAWVLGEHKLFCLDSTNPLSLESLMGRHVARMCFTDPPWNVAIGVDGVPSHRKRKAMENDNLPPAEFALFLRTVTRLISLHLAGDIYCVMSAGEWPLIDASLREAGFHWSSTIIWVKDEFVLGRSKYHRRYEPIWYGWINDESSTFDGGRAQDDVWEYDRPKISVEHPTMKPPPLVERAVENSSKAGDIVLDPFGGSGTTLVVCEKLGRRARVIEKDPRYAAVILDRWAKMTGKQPELVGE